MRRFRPSLGRLEPKTKDGTSNVSGGELPASTPPTRRARIKPKVGIIANRNATPQPRRNQGSDTEQQQARTGLRMPSIHVTLEKDARPLSENNSTQVGSNLHKSNTSNLQQKEPNTRTSGNFTCKKSQGNLTRTSTVATTDQHLAEKAEIGSNLSQKHSVNVTNASNTEILPALTQQLSSNTDALVVSEKTVDSVVSQVHENAPNKTAESNIDLTVGVSSTESFSSCGGMSLEIELMDPISNKPLENNGSLVNNVEESINAQSKEGVTATNTNIVELGDKESFPELSVSSTDPNTTTESGIFLDNEFVSDQSFVEQESTPTSETLGQILSESVELNVQEFIGSENFDPVQTAHDLIQNLLEHTSDVSQNMNSVANSTRTIPVTSQCTCPDSDGPPEQQLGATINTTTSSSSERVVAVLLSPQVPGHPHQSTMLPDTIPEQIPVYHFRPDDTMVPTSEVAPNQTEYHSELGTITPTPDATRILHHPIQMVPDTSQDQTVQILPTTIPDMAIYTNDSSIPLAQNQTALETIDSLPNLQKDVPLDFVSPATNLSTTGPKLNVKRKHTRPRQQSSSNQERLNSLPLLQFDSSDVPIASNVVVIQSDSEDTGIETVDHPILQLPVDLVEDNQTHNVRTNRKKAQPSLKQRFRARNPGPVKVVVSRRMSERSDLDGDEPSTLVESNSVDEDGSNAKDNAPNLAPARGHKSNKDKGGSEEQAEISVDIDMVEHTETQDMGIDSPDGEDAGDTSVSVVPTSHHSEGGRENCTNENNNVSDTNVVIENAASTVTPVDGNTGQGTVATSRRKKVKPNLIQERRKKQQQPVTSMVDNGTPENNVVHVNEEALGKTDGSGTPDLSDISTHRDGSQSAGGTSVNHASGKQPASAGNDHPIVLPVINLEPVTVSGMNAATSVNHANGNSGTESETSLSRKRKVAPNISQLNIRRKNRRKDTQETSGNLAGDIGGLGGKDSETGAGPSIVETNQNVGTPESNATGNACGDGTGNVPEGMVEQLVPPHDELVSVEDQSECPDSTEVLTSVTTLCLSEGDQDSQEITTVCQETLKDLLGTTMPPEDVTKEPQSKKKGKTNEGPKKKRGRPRKNKDGATGAIEDKSVDEQSGSQVVTQVSGDANADGTGSAEQAGVVDGSVGQDGVDNGPDGQATTDETPKGRKRKGKAVKPNIPAKRGKKKAASKETVTTETEAQPGNATNNQDGTPVVGNEENTEVATTKKSTKKRGPRKKTTEKSSEAATNQTSESGGVDGTLLKKKGKRQSRASKDHGPINVSKMRISDMAYFNPKTNPMKDTIPDKGSPIVATPRRQNGETEVVLTDDSEATNAATTEGDSQPTSAVLAPQVTIDAEGNIVLDEESLMIQSTAASENVEDRELVIENTNQRYKSSLKKKQWERWNKEDTLQFYRILSQIGTDFSLMAKLFENKSRTDLKRKFKREEKVNRDLIEKALSQRNPIRASLFAECMEENEKQLEQSMEVQTDENDVTTEPTTTVST